VATGNAADLGVSARAAFREGDWAAGIAGPFDLIVANPPYIAQAELAGLAPEVLHHEPMMALTDGGDGLGAYRAILGTPLPAAPGARLLMEIGPTQGARVSALAQAAGWTGIAIHPDLDGRDRVVAAHWPESPI
jgi:release factor glutamine methyltransferase